MAEMKTVPTGTSVDAYLNGIADEGRRKDCRTLVKLMRKVTGKPPRMWGASIVGFGSYHYKYASGHEGDCFLAGFSSRKQDLTIYVMSGFAGHEGLLARLGRHKTGKSCLYVKRLADVDLKAVEQLLEASVATLKQTYR